MNIGRLKKVELRMLWKHEEYDFSSWLAEPENLSLLSDEIGIELIDPQKETPVGKFSADIVAEEDVSGRKVLIENQLEATNHDHLGKLITYGAGIDAEIILWIVRHAREEHQQAVDWINERTDESLNLFLIQVEAWQIGDSDPAPKFNVVARPNDWAKMVKQATKSRDVSEYNLLQAKFWNYLKEFDHEQVLGNRKVHPQHWYDISLGSSAAHIALTINKNECEMACEIYISKDAGKTLFDKIFSSKEVIENQIGKELNWMRLEHRTASRIKLSIDADITEEDLWNEFCVELIEMVKIFKDTFKKYF